MFYTVPTSSNVKKINYSIFFPVNDGKYAITRHILISFP